MGDAADGLDSVKAMSAGRPVDSAYVFDEFHLSIARQSLTRNGQPLRLGSRAMAILLAFVERAGELLTKEELIARAWPQTFVEENNLRVHITALRRALGDTPDQPRYITNVTGRGYRFVAPVRLIGRDTGRDGPRGHGFVDDPVATIPPGTLPVQLINVIGRDADTETVRGLLRQYRLVTIAGIGGIGKTTVALAVAHAVKREFEAGAYFIDLAAVADAAVVPYAVASTVKVAIEGDAPIASLVARLKDMQALLVLDNCEHVIDRAAEVAEGLLRGAPGIRILATSHEPLRSEGERVLRLAPFELPPGIETETLVEAMRHPAIELFVEQAIANDDALAIGDADVPHIADICRRLDGLPLAIEIAAARAGSLGIAELAMRLDDRFSILTSGRRAAASRQQTLRKLLDWSHDHLSDRERMALRRLSVFSGEFTHEGAVRVALDGLDAPDVTEAVSSLLRKSLLTPGLSAGVSTFRMLDSTRLYALEKLEQAGEVDASRQAHIDWMCGLLQRAEQEWNHAPRLQWLERNGPAIDDIRLALAWAFSERGDAAAGVVLTSLAMPLVLQLGLVVEFYDRAQTAIAVGERLASRQLVPEMRLHLACAMLAFNQNLPYDTYVRQAEALAETIGTDRARIEPLVLGAATHLLTGNYAMGLAGAQEAHDLGKTIEDDLAILAASRVLAQINHFIGDQRRAIDLANAVLRHPVAQIPVIYGFVHTDRRVSMRVTLARALWITGHSSQARQIAGEAMKLARESGSLALCQVLALATIPLLLWRGEDEEALPLIRQLHEEATRFSMGQWGHWAQVFANAVEVKAGRSEPVATLGGLYAQTQITLIGRRASIPPVIDEETWCAPEMLRAKGHTLWLAGDKAGGEAQLLQGLSLAQGKGATAWELRAAMSLAEIWRHGPRHAEGKAILADILARLPEGHGTADPLQAAQLLQGM